MSQTSENERTPAQLADHFESVSNGVGVDMLKGAGWVMLGTAFVAMAGTGVALGGVIPGVYFYYRAHRKFNAAAEGLQQMNSLYGATRELVTEPTANNQVKKPDHP